MDVLSSFILFPCYLAYVRAKWLVHSSSKRCNIQLIRFVCKKTRLGNQKPRITLKKKKKKKRFRNLQLSFVRHCQYFVAGIVDPSSRILGINQTTVLESVIREDRNTRPHSIGLPVWVSEWVSKWVSEWVSEWDVGVQKYKPVKLYSLQ
jgi:hypothetical protein